MATVGLTDYRTPEYLHSFSGVPDGPISQPSLPIFCDPNGCASISSHITPPSYTMNASSRILSRFGASTTKSAAQSEFFTAQCSKQTTRNFARSARRRANPANEGQKRGNAAPTMEQMRAPFAKKNISTLYVYSEISRAKRKTK